jgi:6-pyruvoyltetrahydropterin/6-carboxytetrahydropterin synthase
VTRRYGFSAAHVLAREEWDAERNRRIYGKCANPHGHGHNYGLEITLRGEVDPDSGRLVALDALDALVERAVLAQLDHRFLNRDVAVFSRDVPTAENIARFIWAVLQRALDERALGSVTLDRVRLLETENNAVEYVAEEQGGWPIPKV